MQNANDALVTLIDYLEKAQGRGAFSLREAAHITQAIDFLAQPIASPAPPVEEAEEKESQDSEEPGSES